MSDEEKLVSHYRLKTLLRKDGFGAVYFAEDTRDQKACVLRVIELDHATLTRITGHVRARSQRDHPLIEQIRQRMKRISELKNSHILPVIEFGEEHIQGNNDIIFYMVSPYEKESLLSYWSEHTSRAELIALEIVSELIFQAAEGLFYVHRRGLIHQYVRLSSFMLRETARSHKLHLYLTDFWFADISAALLEDGQISQDLSVYLASEQLASHAVAASDQYALAILAYELLLGYRLSQVDLSIGLYERFVRQRGVEVSEADLQLAHRLDLVLARALSEDVAARYSNIEEFASMFRAVASGEVIELEEDTAKLPVIVLSDQRSSQSGVEIAAIAAGALIAGEIAEEITEERIEGDEATHRHHSSLDKTILTSEGMEVVGSGEVIEEMTASRIAQSGIIAEEDEKERTSAGATGAVDFAAGLVTGEILQSETDIANEQTLIVESSAAAFAAGEARQREIDNAEERTEAREGSAAAFASGATGFAAGLAAGEVLQQETDSAEERTQLRESRGAAFASGAAGGLVAGETLAAEQAAGISLEQTQAIPANGTFAGSTEIYGQANGASVGSVDAYEQATDITAEQTQSRPVVDGALLAGAALLEVGELLTSGLIGTEVAGAAGGSLLVDDFAETQAAGAGTAGAASAGGMSVLDEAALVGGAAAARLAAEDAEAGGYASGGGAGVAGAGLAGSGSEGSTTGEASSTASGTGLVAGGAAGLAGAGLAAEGAGGYAGGAKQAIGTNGAGEAGLGLTGSAGLVGAGLVSEGAGGGYAGGAAGGTTQAASGGGAGLVTGGTTQAAGGGVVGGGVFAAPARRRRGRTLLIAIILALLLLLVFGSLSAYALGQSSSATITLTLASHTIQNTYLVTATTSASTTTTTTTSGQVQANFLQHTASLSQSGQASGYYPGTEASGFLKLSNSSTACGCPVFIPAGTSFVSGSGVTVVIDYGVSVASQCSVTVPAHAMVYGPGGDISAGNVQSAYSSHIWATNPYAFTGGQGGLNNALVQQSDIDHLAGSLRAQVVQSAETNIQAQVKSNQRLFAQPDCKTRVKSDHAAGDNASSVNVTVSAVCAAEAYDYSSAMQIVQKQVQTEASSYSSDQYSLANGLQTAVTSATVTDAKAGTVLLAIKVFGKWIYKLSHGLERYISGKSVSDARAILTQFGAARVDINVSGFNSSTLPSDSSKIKIVVKS